MTFERDETVEMVLEMKINFKGVPLRINRARKPKVKPRAVEYVEGATKIFVGAIPSNVTLSEFQYYFEQFGPIDDISLPMKNKIKGINKGHGFVNYVYPFSAKLAVEQYANHSLRTKWVSLIDRRKTSKAPGFKIAKF